MRWLVPPAVIVSRRQRSTDPCATPNVAAAVLWRKRQMQPRRRSAETKSAPGIFHIMMLAITGQWVAEVTVVLCLFGAACIGPSPRVRPVTAPRTAEQNATERNSAAARGEISSRMTDDGDQRGRTSEGGR